MNKIIEQLRVKIFLDGASKAELYELYKKPYIKGLTTNPTLMRKEGIIDYPSFAKEMIDVFPERPISFGVYSDDFTEMEQQALKIASWGENVFVKIPITNTKGELSYNLVKKLSAQGVKVNITAVMTEEQVLRIIEALSPEVPSYISLFAGRIADTGRDPMVIIASVLDLIKEYPLIELIWASPRELFNVFQADTLGCHIITVTHDILKKLPLVGYSLEDYSLDTVKMFHEDALAAGFELAL